jgi:hypothetical protein
MSSVNEHQYLDKNRFIFLNISLSAPVVHALMKLNKLIDFREMVDIEGSLKYNCMNPVI